MNKKLRILFCMLLSIIAICALAIVGCSDTGTDSSSSVSSSSVTDSSPDDSSTVDTGTSDTDSDDTGSGNQGDDTPVTEVVVPTALTVPGDTYAALADNEDGSMGKYDLYYTATASGTYTFVLSGSDLTNVTAVVYVDGTMIGYLNTAENYTIVTDVAAGQKINVLASVPYNTEAPIPFTVNITYVEGSVTPTGTGYTADNPITAYYYNDYTAKYSYTVSSGDVIYARVDASTAAAAEMYLTLLGNSGYTVYIVSDSDEVTAEDSAYTAVSAENIVNGVYSFSVAASKHTLIKVVATGDGTLTVKLSTPVSYNITTAGGEWDLVGLATTGIGYEYTVVDADSYIITVSNSSHVVITTDDTTNTALYNEGNGITLGGESGTYVCNVTLSANEKITVTAYADSVLGIEQGELPSTELNLTNSGLYSDIYSGSTYTITVKETGNYTLSISSDVSVTIAGQTVDISSGSVTVDLAADVAITVTANSNTTLAIACNDSPVVVVGTPFVVFLDSNVVYNYTTTVKIEEEGYYTVSYYGEDHENYYVVVGDVNSSYYYNSRNQSINYILDNNASGETPILIPANTTLSVNIGINTSVSSATAVVLIQKSDYEYVAPTYDYTLTEDGLSEDLEGDSSNTYAYKSYTIFVEDEGSYVFTVDADGDIAIEVNGNNTSLYSGGSTTLKLSEGDVIYVSAFSDTTLTITLKEEDDEPIETVEGVYNLSDANLESSVSVGTVIFDDETLKLEVYGEEDTTHKMYYNTHSVTYGDGVTLADGVDNSARITSSYTDIGLTLTLYNESTITIYYGTKSTANSSTSIVIKNASGETVATLCTGASDTYTSLGAYTNKLAAGTYTLCADGTQGIAIYSIVVETEGGNTPVEPTVSSIVISGENTVVEGGSLTLTATVYMSDETTSTAYTVTWTSSNTSVATVENGVVTAVAAGNVTITASIGEITKTIEITVTAKPIAITLNTAESVELTSGAEDSADSKTGTFTTENDGWYTFTITTETASNVQVLIYDKTYEYYVSLGYSYRAGTTTYTDCIYIPGGTELAIYFNQLNAGSTDSLSFLISYSETNPNASGAKTAELDEKITLSDNASYTISITEAGTYIIMFEGIVSDYNDISFTVGNTTYDYNNVVNCSDGNSCYLVFTLDEDEVGDITITFAATSKYSGSYTATVSKAAVYSVGEAIDLTEASSVVLIDLSAAGGYTLTIALADSGDISSYIDDDTFSFDLTLPSYTNINYSDLKVSSDGTYALLSFTITENDADVYAIEFSLYNYSGTLSYTATFDEVKVSGVKLSGNSTVAAGESLTLEATVTMSDGSTSDDTAITWTSSDTDVATVEDGVVTAITTGTVTIKAAVNDEIYDTITLTVTASGVHVYNMSDYDEQLTVSSSTVQETATIVDDDSVKITVDNGCGYITATNRNGNLEVDDGVDLTYYVGVNASANITLVLKTNATVTIYYSTRTSSASLVINDSDGEQIESYKTGTSANYVFKTIINLEAGTYTLQGSSAALIWSFIVDTNEPTVTEVEISGFTTVQEGETITLTPNVTTSNGSAYTGTVSWTSSDTSVATVDENGVVTAVAAGKVTITATADGVEGTYEITVTAKPDPVTVGENYSADFDGETTSITTTLTITGEGYYTVTLSGGDATTYVHIYDDNGLYYYHTLNQESSYIIDNQSNVETPILIPAGTVLNVTIGCTSVAEVTILVQKADYTPAEDPGDDTVSLDLDSNGLTIEFDGETYKYDTNNDNTYLIEVTVKEAGTYEFKFTGSENLNISCGSWYAGNVDYYSGEYETDSHEFAIGDVINIYAYCAGTLTITIVEDDDTTVLSTDNEYTLKAGTTYTFTPTVSGTYTITVGATSDVLFYDDNFSEDVYSGKSSDVELTAGVTYSVECYSESYDGSTVTIVLKEEATEPENPGTGDVETNVPTTLVSGADGNEISLAAGNAHDGVSRTYTTEVNGYYVFSITAEDTSALDGYVEIYNGTEKVYTLTADEKSATSEGYSLYFYAGTELTIKFYSSTAEGADTQYLFVITYEEATLTIDGTYPTELKVDGSVDVVMVADDNKDLDASVMVDADGIYTVSIDYSGSLSELSISVYLDGQWVANLSSTNSYSYDLEATAGHSVGIGAYFVDGATATYSFSVEVSYEAAYVYALTGSAYGTYSAAYGTYTFTSYTGSVTLAAGESAYYKVATASQNADGGTTFNIRLTVTGSTTFTIYASETKDDDNADKAADGSYTIEITLDENGIKEFTLNAKKYAFFMITATEDDTTITVSLTEEGEGGTLSDEEEVDNNNYVALKGNKTTTIEWKGESTAYAVYYYITLTEATEATLTISSDQSMFSNSSMISYIAITLTLNGESVTGSSPILYTLNLVEGENKIVISFAGQNTMVDGYNYTVLLSYTDASHVHSYTIGNWTWSEDYSSATLDSIACDGCDEVITIGETVNSTNEVTSTASCSTYGEVVYTVTYTYEGVEYTDTVNVSTPYAHDLKYVEAVAPTASAAGHEEYYYCSVCGKYFTDAEGENEVDYADLVLTFKTTNTLYNMSEASLTTSTYLYNGNTLFDGDISVASTSDTTTSTTTCLKYNTVSDYVVAEGVDTTYNGTDVDFTGAVYYFTATRALSFTLTQSAIVTVWYGMGYTNTSYNLYISTNYGSASNVTSNAVAKFALDSSASTYTNNYYKYVLEGNATLGAGTYYLTTNATSAATYANYVYAIAIDYTLGGTVSGDTGTEATTHTSTFSISELETAMLTRLNTGVEEGSEVESVADKTQLATTDFTGSNAFLTLLNTQTSNQYRTNNNGVIEIKGEGLSVTFSGTGTITISFASTGSANVSSLALIDSEGNYVTGVIAETTATTETVSTENGYYYNVTGSSTYVTITFTVEEAGTYIIATNLDDENQGRAARISAIEMVDYYVDTAAAE